MEHIQGKPELVSVKFGETTKKAFVTLRVNLTNGNVKNWQSEVIEAVKEWGNNS